MTKHNDHEFVRFAFGSLSIRLCFQDDDNINRLILTYQEKFFCKKNFKLKNFNQKPRHQVVEEEAMKVEAETIQKLALPHTCFYPHKKDEKLQPTNFECKTYARRKRALAFGTALKKITSLHTKASIF